MPSDILQQIVSQKKREVEQLYEQNIEQQFSDEANKLKSVRCFSKALETLVKQKKIAVIAECKQASPSKGIIRENYNPQEIALSYQNNGVNCISVLTDELFFKGSKEHLQAVKKAVHLPIIRKDFIIDKLQILESRAIGADCILLIVAILSDKQLQEFYRYATDLGLDVLVEAHTIEEIERANQIKPKLLGINNRNLKTFEVDLNTTIEGKNYAHPEATIICESGIYTAENIRLMVDNGVYGFLIGESLMKHPVPGEKLQSIMLID